MLPGEEELACAPGADGVGQRMEGHMLKEAAQGQITYIALAVMKIELTLLEVTPGF